MIIEGTQSADMPQIEADVYPYFNYEVVVRRFKVKFE